MENIGNFLDGGYAYGVVKTDTFQTVDLYEGENMAQVCCCSCLVVNSQRRWSAFF